MTSQTTASILNFASLLERAHARASVKKPRAALIAPDNPDALAAFLKAAVVDLIDPLIIGDPAAIKRLANEAGEDVASVKIETAPDLDTAVNVALGMVADGKIDLLAQGGSDAASLTAQLQDKNAGFIPNGSLLSHVGVIKAERYPRLLFVTDGLIHDDPDLKTKLGLAANLACACSALGVPEPRTAVVTAVEAIYPQMAATLDGAVMAKMSERRQIKELKIDGPLSFDVAIDPEAAAAKGIKNSEVAGRADGMIASSRHVASGIYQALSLFAACDLGGVLVGGIVPVATAFRTDSRDTRYHSLALATLLA